MNTSTKEQTDTVNLVISIDNQNRFIEAFESRSEFEWDTELLEDTKSGTRWIGVGQVPVQTAREIISTPTEHGLSDLRAQRINWEFIQSFGPDDTELTTSVAQPVPDGAHAVMRKVVIGWRFTKRESFPALHKAAAKFPPTAHLANKHRYFVRAYYSQDCPEANVWRDWPFPFYERDNETGPFATEAEAQAMLTNLVR